MFGEIEGTGFEILDTRFSNCLTGHGRVERLWTGARWTEGPVWFAAGRYLLFSDIPNNRILRWDETDGTISPGPSVRVGDNSLSMQMGRRPDARVGHGGSAIRPNSEGGGTLAE